MIYIAIDPGQTGGIAICEPGKPVGTFNMPETPRDILDLLRDLTRERAAECTCWMEKVGGYFPGNSAPASVKFARHCGHLDMAIISLFVPSDTVLPSTWMNHLGSVPREKNARKNWIKAKMQARYPHLKVTLATADALGILTWAMETKGVKK